jgi:CheY-like chemotaxis protein
MKNVIIARDVYELLMPEQSFLSRADVRTRTAGSNSEALALHRAEKADLIIAYLDTEDISGEELCEKIRGDAGMRGVSILLVCAAQEREIDRCLECKANAYVTMPISTAILLQEAYRLLHIAPRKICRVPVKIRLVCATRGKRFTGMMESISTAGLFFRSSASIPEGATVNCTFALAGSRQMTVSGEVVRTVTDQPQAGYQHRGRIRHRPLFRRREGLFRSCRPGKHNADHAGFRTVI